MSHLYTGHFFLRSNVWCPSGQRVVQIWMEIWIDKNFHLWVLPCKSTTGILCNYLRYIAMISYGSMPFTVLPFWGRWTSKNQDLFAWSMASQLLDKRVNSWLMEQPLQPMASVLQLFKRKSRFISRITLADFCGSSLWSITHMRTMVLEYESLHFTTKINQFCR